MNAVICRDVNARGAARRKGGPGNGRRGPWTGLAALLSGVILGACLVASGEAHAYTSYRFSEGDRWEIKQNLPSFPHEARRYATGYSGVQYILCTSDGTATGGPFSFTAPAGTDYFGECNGNYYTLKSTGRFNKQINLNWFTIEDTVQEGDEYFWIKLDSPRVKKWGSNTWQSHSGSTHVPSSITIQVIIVDDD